MMLVVKAYIGYVKPPTDDGNDEMRRKRRIGGGALADSVAVVHTPRSLQNRGSSPHCRVSRPLQAYRQEVRR